MTAPHSDITLRPATCADADVLLPTVLTDALPVTLHVSKDESARRLSERPGFEVVGEDEIEFYMWRAPRASAEIEAE